MPWSSTARAGHPRRARRTVAALAPLLILGLAPPAPAQEATAEPPLAEGEVRLEAPGLRVRGRALGYDGRFLRVETAEGELTFDLSALACEGACPDPEGFVPELELRLAGDAALGEVLLPALVEGYAAARGWSVERQGDGFVLRAGEADGGEGGAAGSEALRVSLRPSTTAEGIADLLASRADLALLARAPGAAESALLEEAGLGGEGEWRLRVLAQGALVPVTGAGQRVGRISLGDLAQAFAGEIASWSALGGEDAPLAAHLGPEGSAAAEAFLAEVMEPLGLALSEAVVRHPTEAALAVAVAADPLAIGILPWEGFGEAQPMALVGECGLPWVPRTASVRAGDYPLTVPLGLLQPMRRLAPEAQGFVSWLATPEAALVLRRAGLVGAEGVPIPWAEQGERLAAAVRAAGPEVPLRELQRLVRVLGPFTRLSTTFRFEGGTRLDADSRGMVLRLAHEVAEGRFAGRTLILAGFSDGRGPAEENRRLSVARAEAVEAALLEGLGGALPEGLSLRVHAFGEALPMGCDDPREGPWGARVNRRVELWVSG